MSRKKITPAQLDRMEIDEAGRLYWDGVPIVTDAKIALSNAQNIFAIIVGIATVLGGLGSFMQGIKALL